MTGSWRHFSHGADIGVCGRGESPAEAFEQAALALTAAITERPVAALEQVRLACRASSLELLLVEWLDAVIYEMAVRGLLFGRFEPRIEPEPEAGWRLVAELWGEPVEGARHAPACEAKGATYTALRVAEEPDGDWTACCVVDV